MDIMTKVRVLWEKVAGLETKEEATSATLAGILPRIPKDYSTEETPTGQKWIDGKEIYCKTFVGDIEAISELTNIQLAENFSNMIWSVGYVATSNDRYYCLNGYVSSTIRSSLALQNDILYLTVGTGLSEGSYEIIVFYTKPDPVPAQLDKGTGMITGEDPEPETKKRKTTKKEDK